MIKCIGYLKSLKQLFIISLISCFILLGNSFVKGAYYEKIGVSNSSPYDTNVLVSVLPKGSLMSSMLGQGKSFLTLGNKVRGTSGKGAYAYYMWIDKRLYFYSSTYTTSTDSTVSNRQGFLTTYSICDYPDIQYTYLSNCDTYTYNSTAINDFLTTVDTNEYYWISAEISSNILVGAFCVSSTTYNKQLCFRSSDISSANLTGSLNFPSQMNFDSVDGYDSQSPAVPIIPTPTPGGNSQVGNGGELDGVNYTVIDTGDIVYYFENNPYYRFDKGVCYVGTDDFTTLYSSGSTLGLFRANSGGTIFDLFSSQFGNTFTINQVGTFINARNLNYFTWFKGGNRDENNIPMFNAYYSINSGFYQDFSDNLIVPFIGNPIAFYFMGYVSSLYGEYSTPGQAISTYCYYKLGLDKDSGSMNITDDSDKVFRDNASDFINQRNKFYGLSSGNMVIQSQSWSGTILDYFTGGEDNYDFNTFFSSSFNKFKDKISLNLSDLGAGFLPTWIIMFLIAIIFFRFLSH